MSSLESEHLDASSQPSRSARWVLNAIQALMFVSIILAIITLVFHAPIPAQLNWLLNFLAPIILILLLPSGAVLVRDVVRRGLLDLTWWSVRIILGAFVCAALSMAYLMEEQLFKPAWLPSSLTAVMAVLSFISLIALLVGAIWFAVESFREKRRT
jgi:uncharacterized membrane protein YhaH (DUF805 family)